MGHQGQDAPHARVLVPEAEEAKVGPLQGPRALMQVRPLIAAQDPGTQQDRQRPCGAVVVLVGQAASEGLFVYAALGEHEIGGWDKGEQAVERRAEGAAQIPTAEEGGVCGHGREPAPAPRRASSQAGASACGPKRNRDVAPGEELVVKGAEVER